MFAQTLIILFLGSQINGFALDAYARNARLYPNVGSRIVGGSDAPTGTAGHMVAILTGQVIRSLMCGGTIITKKDILTAAHCIEPAVIWGELLPSYHGVVGSYYWNSTDIKVSFITFHIHPGWNPWTIKDDVGILVTAGIPLSDRVSVMPLNFNWIEEEKSLANGWGTIGYLLATPDRLQTLDVATISGAECVRRMLQMEAQGWWLPTVEPHRELCTYHSPGYGMCHGDSGSALLHKKTKSQIGIVSWGIPCAVGGPDVFVRVSAYKDWILDIVGKK